MGNEQSVSEEPTQTEKNPEKLGNGSVNGSVNGLSEISAVGAETTLEKNGSSLLLSLATEPNGTNQVTDEGDGERRDQGEEEEHDEEHIDAPDFNEVSEKAVKQEEVKKSKGKKGSRFGKLFNIKPHLKNVPQEESSGESPAGLSPPEAEAQQESSGDKAAWLRTLAGGEAGSQLGLMQPEDALSQPAVVAAEEQSARITTEEVLVMNEAYQNVSFSAEMELEEGVFSPQVPSRKPASTDQKVASGLSVPLTKADAQELNSGGRRVLSRPGKKECIPLVARAQRLRGAGSALAKAEPVSTPEAAVEAFFQLLGHVALPEPAVDARILLEDQAVVTETFVALFGEEETNLLTPEKRSGDSPGAVDEEAL